MQSMTSDKPTFRSLSGLNECIGDDALVENECAPIIDHAENAEFDQA
jgi:hypothetical protein